MVHRIKINLKNIEVIIPSVRTSSALTLQQLCVVLISSARLERAKERFDKVLSRLFPEHIEIQGNKRLPTRKVQTDENATKVEEKIFVLVEYESKKRGCFCITMNNGDFSFEKCRCPKHLEGQYYHRQRH